MSVVTLVSGGIDSSLMAILTEKEGIIQYPLFIDYGQLSRHQEWLACKRIHKMHRLSKPVRLDISGFGRFISSGITDSAKDIYIDAFLPSRNLLFLLAGSAYAYQKRVNAVSIGLLNEDSHLFPDQTKAFLEKAEEVISLTLDLKIKIIAPLMSFHKRDVIELAVKYGINETYSCHSGQDKPCGKCISCKEILSASMGGG
jgi:7-cyano-7-deazaguanine synthase